MKRNKKVIGRCAQAAAVFVVAGSIAGCLSSGSSEPAAASADELAAGATFAVVTGGTVGGGPVAGARVSLTDAGSHTTSVTSNQQGHYSIRVPRTYRYPFTLSTSGGTDVVTGMAPPFRLRSSTTRAATTLHVTPFTTVATRTAGALGGITATNRAKATQILFDKFSFGLDPQLVADPFTSPINDANVATLVKAGEALTETVARTSDALLAGGPAATGDQVVAALAGDLSDGVIDGNGPGADARIAATANVVSAQVLYEAMRNHLVIRGVDATSAMDSAILTLAPGTTKRTGDVTIPESMLRQARIAVAAAIAIAPSPQMQAIASTLGQLSGPTTASALDAALSDGGAAPFEPAIAAVSTGTASQWDSVNSVVRNGGTVQPPTDPPSDPPTDPTPTPTPGSFEFSAATYSVQEGAGTFSATVRRVNGSDGAATVQWRTRTFDGYGTADWASDYGTVNWTTLSFADGETSKVVSVRITDDTVVEGNETFSLLLGTPTGGATLGTSATAVVTIVDNDTAPAPTTLKYPPDTSASSGTTTVATLAKPAYLTPVTEPVYKTKLTRVTDLSALSSSYARHEYSKRSVWNSDGSLMLINSANQNYRFLLDGKTYKRVGTVTVGLGELVWSNTNPSRMFAVNGLAFNSVNPATNTSTTLRTFSGYDRCYLGPWEGNVSADDHYAALACGKGSDLVVVVYDITNNAIVTTRTFAGMWGDANLDWVTISASGKYVVAKWMSGPNAVLAYDRNTMNQVSTLGSSIAHGDVGFDAAGNDVYVAYDAYGGVRMFRMTDGATTQLLPASANILAGHISCRNLKRPGWAYLSPYDAYGKVTTKDVYALKLDGSQTVERFAQHHSTAGSYDSQPQASVSMDGTKVIFASNWGGSEVNSYVVEVP